MVYFLNAKNKENPKNGLGEILLTNYKLQTTEVILYDHIKPKVGGPINITTVYSAYIVWRGVWSPIISDPLLLGIPP